MSKKVDLNRIIELRELLHEYNFQYYVNSKSLISDYEFDILLKELEALEEKYDEFSDPNSPTKRVGGAVTKSFASVDHKYPMLSLSNSYSIENITDFDNRIRKLISKPFSYICELKYDGVAISLIYKNGKLAKGVTRGDGVSGEDVTNNIRTITSIPLHLKGEYPEEIEVRGEVIFSRPVFELLNAKREKDGLPLFSNPRNTASGTLKLQDSSVVAQRKLDCFLYGVYMDDSPINLALDQYRFLMSLGFKTPSIKKQFIQSANSIEEIMSFVNYWDEKRVDLPFEIDGVVIKVNEIDLQNLIGNTAKSPRWAIAYKFKALQVKTVLEDIVYQVGRTGAITPVAQLNPVEISGTIVKRASVHNADQIKKLDIRKGDVVYVEKGGEIIPKIVRVDLSARQKNSKKISFINKCPECNADLIRDDGEAQHYCSKPITCPPQIKGRIIHFIGRKQMNIDGVGAETIEQLYSAGLIRDVADLYDLKKEDILPLDRMAEKSVDNIINGINDSRKIPFQKVLFALGVRYVGETVAKKLALHFNNIEKIRHADIDALCNVDEIGEKIALSIIDFFSSDQNNQLVDRLKDKGLIMKLDDNQKKGSSTALSGKRIVVSGRFSNVSREKLKELIELNGGKNITGVSSSTDILVVGENIGPSKLQKAKKYNVKMINEIDFLNQIAGFKQSDEENQPSQGELF